MKLATDRMIGLYEGTAPSAGKIGMVGGAGGGLPENQATGSAVAYFAGGWASKAVANDLIQEAGPSGYLLAGGARRSGRKSKKSKSKSKSKSKKLRRSRRVHKVNFR